MPYKKKTKNGLKWIGRVQKDGAIKQKSFLTKAGALEWEAEERKREWEQPKPQEEKILTAFSWANDYLDFAKERFSKKTFEEKRSAFVRFFKKFSPDLPIAEGLQMAEVLAHLREQAKERSGYAANKDRKNLVAAWTWGIKFLGLPSKNPFKDSPRFAEERSPRYIPPEEDFWKVYNVLEKEQDKIMLLAFLHTAARKNEILSLKWADVDFPGNKIQLWTKKRADGSLEYDKIPMTEDLKKGLLFLREKSLSLFVFAKEDGQPYKLRQHWMKNACQKAGVKYFTLHAIRHLTASILDAAGLELSTIQAILRHKSATTTARYLHSLRGTKAALDDVFSSKIVQIKRPSGG